MWHDDPHRLDLVDRGIGAVAAAAESIEEHLAAQALAHARGQGRVAGTVGRQDHGVRMQAVPIACKVFIGLPNRLNAKCPSIGGPTVYPCCILRSPSAMLLRKYSILLNNKDIIMRPGKYFILHRRCGAV